MFMLINNLLCGHFLPAESIPVHPCWVTHSCRVSHSIILHYAFYTLLLLLLLYYYSIKCTLLQSCILCWSVSAVGSVTSSHLIWREYPHTALSQDVLRNRPPICDVGLQLVRFPLPLASSEVENLTTLPPALM